MTVAERKDISNYLNRPYNIIIKSISDESGDYYVARVLEFNGCVATGETREEAYQAIYEVLEGFIEDMLEDGEAIPEPISDDEYSGNLRVRMPKSLHRDLSQAAKLEGVSLNQYLINKLSK
ncbi:type II toxin-antitoxin system HicB family antitoxin [Salinicoccus halodurans]|uniref:Pilus assembly protein HicB n=1 Tax=Salinicoccus halodurans TaxID=407035 RepID=A0A0F7D4G4_9STAP|nr:type II toxin-antitoxin system HicB family antitoxin [Salinicoccus halodurans]AKG74190.1 pilus assembly protein HicB [Salinicoccus halodurans]SFK92852.1 Predicted nuclease of the RNAse H fold, HicB family [Salinicoccus halodurans]